MLAAVGQLAAVCIGIPSIIYLAVQIRAQTKERRQAAVNALTVQWGDLTCALHESAELWYDTPDNGIGYAMHYSRSHDAVLRVYMIFACTDLTSALRQN